MISSTLQVTDSPLVTILKVYTDLDPGAIEEVIAAHPAVAECSVFGLADDLKGEVPLGT